LARRFNSTDYRHYPQERGARFAEGGGRFTGMPRMTLRLRYRTWKLRALCWVLRRARGAPFSARRQETGKLRHIQEIEMADGREAMPKRGLINGSFSLFA
jgi:hypothetical protein